jgi:septal ring factor EnvC (AmiA/AmiB activator)
MASAEAIEELGRSSRRAAVASLLGVVIVLASLAYSGWMLHGLQEKVEKADEQLKSKQQQIQDLDADIKVKQMQAQVLQRTLLRAGSASPESGAQVQQALSAEIESQPETAKFLPRVWLHIREESQRGKASRVADALVAAGFSVPGIELVGKKAPDENQVRYFEKTDQATNDCKAITDAVGDLKLTFEKRYIAPSPNLAPIHPRHYEIWFGLDF